MAECRVQRGRAHQHNYRFPGIISYPSSQQWTGGLQLWCSVWTLASPVWFSCTTSNCHGEWWHSTPVQSSPVTPCQCQFSSSLFVSKTWGERPVISINIDRSPQCPEYNLYAKYEIWITSYLVPSIQPATQKCTLSATIDLVFFWSTFYDVKILWPLPNFCVLLDNSISRQPALFSRGKLVIWN